MSAVGTTVLCAHCRRPIIGTPFVTGNAGDSYHAECARSPYWQEMAEAAVVEPLVKKAARAACNEIAHDHGNRCSWPKCGCDTGDQTALAIRTYLKLASAASEPKP